MTGFSRTILSSLAGALFLLACGTPPQSAGDAKDSAKSKTDGDKEAPVATASSCETLAKKICEEAGEATGDAVSP